MTFKRVRLWTMGCVLCLLQNVNAGVASSQALAVPADAPLEVEQITGKLGLNNTITVEIKNLAEYLKHSGKDAKKFILYLEWRPIKGVSPRLIDGTNKLQFEIRNTYESKGEWNKLLGRPKHWTYVVPVSIGYENDNPIPSAITYPLVVIEERWFWGFVGFLALLLLGSLLLAGKTTILRDPCPALAPSKRPFSLGRAQMGFWFLVVAISYVFIWCVTSDRDSLTETALGLIGISAATALGAAVVGSTKREAEDAAIRDLQSERAEQEAELEREKQLQADQSRLDQGRAKLEQVNKEISQWESKGFVKDLLSDGSGITLHRYQIFVWTIVLGFMFVVSIYNNLAMPEFSRTLLALLGISGGTYIGFKFPE